MPKIFSSFLSSFNVISKKKRHRADKGIFMLIFTTKKKVLHLNSATFLRDLCDIPERGTINRHGLRFLAGNKNAGIRKISVQKCQKKFRTFFPLTGNTGLNPHFVTRLLGTTKVDANCLINCIFFRMK